MVYIRGHRDDYDHWAALGNTGWSYDEVLPYFKKSEHNERIKYRIEKEVLEPSWKTNRLHVEHLKQKEIEKKSTL